MKRILLTFGLLTLFFVPWNETQAQFKNPPPQNLPKFDDDFWHWGYYFGITYFDFKVDYKWIENEWVVKPSPGFNVGLISDFRLGKMWNIRLEPGVFFADRTIYFRKVAETVPGLQEVDTLRHVRSNYAAVPVLIKFSAWRNGNMRPYITAGMIWNYNLSSYQNSVFDNSAGRFRMKKSVWMWTIGIGFEMYMYYFKFTPSIRGVFSLTNEFVPDNDPDSPWTSNVEYVGTRGVYITLTFE